MQDLSPQLPSYQPYPNPHACHNSSSVLVCDMTKAPQAPQAPKTDQPIKTYRHPSQKRMAARSVAPEAPCLGGANHPRIDAKVVDDVVYHRVKGTTLFMPRHDLKFIAWHHWLEHVVGVEVRLVSDIDDFTYWPAFSNGPHGRCEHERCEYQIDHYLAYPNGTLEPRFRVVKPCDDPNCVDDIPF